MRKSKEKFDLFAIGAGILFLALSFIKSLCTPFMLAAGAAIIAYGLISYLFEHCVHTVWRAKIMDDDERNIVIAGKANTIVSEFANIGFIVLALYSYIYKQDLMGCIITIIIFLLSHIIYAISFKFFDRG